MTLYGIIETKTGSLLSLLAGTRCLDDCGEVTTSQRYLTVTGVLEVGPFLRQPLFVTSDLDLVRYMLATGRGTEYRNEIRIELTRGPFAIVDVATMAVVDPGPPTGDLKEAIERALRIP